MFFVLSKTLGIMLLPTNFLIGTGSDRRDPAGDAICVGSAASLMVASVVLLAICAWSPLGKLLLYPLETRFPPWDAGKGAPDGIIVLGGPIDADLSVAHGRPVVRPRATASWRRATLAHRYPNARLRLFRRQSRIWSPTMRRKPTTPANCSKASA